MRLTSRKPRSFQRNASTYLENKNTSIPKKEIDIEKPPYTFYSDNGTKFVFHEALTKDARKIGKDYNVFIATLTNGYQSFVLFEGNNPIYDNQQLDAFAVRLHIMYLANKKEGL